jgi:adenylate cyclase
MRLLTSIWMVVTVMALLLTARVFDVEPLQILRLKTFDYYQKIQPRTATSNAYVIVEVTESDLKKYGQWPWPRTAIAGVHQAIINQGAKLVQYNILFSEPDRLNPTAFADSQNLSEDLKTELKNLPSNDSVLAETIRSTNTVLMYSIKYTPTEGDIKKLRILPDGADPRPWMYNFDGLVTNLAELLNTAKGAGVNIMIPSIDGTVRSLPTVINTDRGIVPGQIIEVGRVLSNSRAIKITTGDDGIKMIWLSKDFAVPVDQHGMVNINFADPNTVPVISVDDLINGKQDLKNKIVIVGLNAAGLSQFKDTPLGLMTDMQITAQAMDTLATDSSLWRNSHTNLMEILYTLVFGLIFILLLPRLNVLWTAAVLLVSLSGTVSASWYAYTELQWLIDISFSTLFITIVWSHLTFNNFATQFRLRQQIKKQFEHYLAPDMVAKLQKDPSLLKLGGETRVMTFLFSDIRGFTPISEKYKGNPEGLTKLINRFLTRMTDVIIRNGGTIDKFMGDCIMAFWNAPLDMPDHAHRAVQSAVEMQAELKLLNETLSAEGLPQINIGIGINTGEALVGNMGSEQRFDYSVIGDDVNLASRLESSSKELDTVLVIGEKTKKQAKDYKYKSLGTIRVKGKTEAIKVYTI